MFLKSMVIDGFKSYGARVEISGFDPFFNAITGLNGSGKSNILDAICFLLGISNLSQVRATNLHELVYKNGQTGITKATVSITFDNRDKTQSPIGYEQQDEITVTRQVVVGGRNKYSINGMNAQNSRVQDLFHSVQLNVNNPHFLIMQGRITKVLNMKPPEILSMIEEAAGTKMYESKKQAAQKTIERKDAKLKEINALINEDISPTLNKLKDDRASYLDFQKIQRELEHLTKIWVAYQFVTSEEGSKTSKEAAAAMGTKIKELEDENQKAQAGMEQLEEMNQILEKKRSEEGGAKLDGLEATLKEKQTAETKVLSIVKNNKENVKGEMKKQKEVQKTMDEDMAAMEGKKKELEKFESGMKSMRDGNKEDLDRLAAAQKRLQAVSAGLSSNADGEDATLADQLMGVKSEIAATETESKTASMKLKHADGELKKKKKEVNSVTMDHQQDEKTLAEVEKSLKRIEGALGKLNYNANHEEELIQRRRVVITELNRLKEQLEMVQSRYPQLNFDYKDPEPNFDRSTVYGMVCNLFQIKDMKTATAIEVSSGARLFNIVVDNEATAKKLLERGDLKRRHTIIPLNRIDARTFPSQLVQRAERLVGKGNVSTALSLVNYPNPVKKAMEFVLGSTFVCPDMNVAKRVAFDPSIEKRTVTLDGEVFDPAGTLTGGSRSQSGSILCHVKDIKELKEQVEQMEKELKAIDRQLEEMKATGAKYHQLKHQLQLEQNKADLVQQKLQQSQHYMLKDEIKGFEATIVEQEALIVRCRESKEKLTKKAADLEYKVAHMAETREKELKEAEMEVTACKKKVDAYSKELKDKETEVDTLKLEIEELQKGVDCHKQQMLDIEGAIAQMEEKNVQLQEQCNAAKEEVAKAKADVDEQKSLLIAKNKEISENYAAQEDLLKFINGNNLKLTNMNHEKSKLATAVKENGERSKHLLRKYEWIAEDRQFFGEPNTAYDFGAIDLRDAGNKIKTLEEKKNKLAKEVKVGAMNLLGKAEEQYQDLLKKKKVVENDRAKIEAVIRELDEKKNEALQSAWERVDKGFGSIFTTLLPGTKAKLVPPSGHSFLDGLEVKVAFGNVWKESLNELSGGQRSLVALSLILSMLLFKPAPIYILDEVDAALDLSHTQNIGQMLRTHFSHSQFIVVSLKDGMFNNANVLFRTKFVDGNSTVTRHAQRQN